MTTQTSSLRPPPTDSGIRVGAGDPQKLFTFDLRLPAYPAHLHISVMAISEREALSAAYLIADEFAERATVKLEATRGL